jgi:hypothetical protein
MFIRLKPFVSRQPVPQIVSFSEPLRTDCSDCFVNAHTVLEKA